MNLYECLLYQVFFKGGGGGMAKVINTAIARSQAKSTLEYI